MAKDKKAAKELTIEEKLSQALVPVEEQPYKIPENWCWVHLCDSFNNYTNSRKKIQSKEYQEKGKLAIVDQGRELIGGYTDDESMAYSGELPVIIFGDHTRCIKFIDFPFAQGADGVKVIEPKKFYDTKAFYYALQSIDIPNMGYRRHFSLFSQFAIPVPPFEEQCRIVDRIESIFSKLDEAKEKAQAVVDGFELRKSAILHKAFTGELTNQWRADRGISLDNWKKKKLIEVLVDKPRNGYSPKPVDYKTSCKSMTLSATTSGYFREECFKYIDEKIDVSSYLWLKPGDILIQRANSLDKVGTSAVFTGKEHEFIYPDLMMKLQVKKEEVSSQFIAYQIKTDQILQYLRKNATGTAGNMPKINQKVVSSIPIICPSIEEQNLIVKYIEKLLSKEQQSKKLAETVINQIDVMKKAVLARAFRGELGTNDLTEEAAIEVLKLILQKE